MMKGFNMLCGFPRSGSTLLCNILNMNPAFNATATSPLMDILKAQQASFSHNEGFKASNRLNIYDRFCRSQRGFLEAFCDYDKFYFDKNRSWTSYIPEIDSILGHTNSKLIFCYRNPIDVIASMENAHKKTPLIQHTEEALQKGSMNTLAKRVSLWIGDNGFFATSMWNLQYAIESGHKKRIYIVDYEKLCKNTQGTMNDIHTFLDLETYDYSKNDFKDLKQTTWELDTFYNHKYPHDIVEGAIEYSEPKPVQLEIITNNYSTIIEERFKWIMEYCSNANELNSIT